MWALSKVTRKPPVGIRQAVVMEFEEWDENGVKTGKTHPYTEEGSWQTDAGIARLAADRIIHLDQLSALPIGDLDLPTIQALVDQLAPEVKEPPTEQELAAIAKRKAIIADLELQRAQRKAIELGVLKPDAADVVEVQARVDAAMKEDPDLVLSLIR